MLVPASVYSDLIKFKHGAKKQCVILDDDGKWVSFLTSYGEMKMPKSRIEEIEKESEEVNDALRKKWNQKSKQVSEDESKEAEEPTAEKPETDRSYTIEIKKRRVMLGARASGLSSEEPVALFIIEDKGMVEGSRLFHIFVTSYKAVTVDIAPPDFHVIAANSARIDPRPLEGYDDLDARLPRGKTASGYVCFPSNAKFEKLVHKSDLAEFELDLGSGEFAVNEGVL